MNPLREVDRNEVVDHCRAHARTLCRIHPVAEVEDVEVADDTLGGKAAGTTPGRSERVRRGNQRQLPLDVDSVEGGLDGAPPSHARGREGNDVVPARLRDPDERAANVVADSGAGVRQRGDVDDDPHGPGDGTYRNPLTSTPSRRKSGLFNTG